MTDLSKCKLELDYPCFWEYKLIVCSLKDAQDAIEQIMHKREHELTPSKISKKGKFESHNLKTLVHNEEDRVTLYELFGKHELIKMVL